LSARRLEKTEDEMKSRRGDFVPTIKLDGRDLQAAMLNGVDLRRVSLSRAVMRGVNLSEAQLQGADLAGALLEDANLSGVRLQGADLRCVGLPNAADYQCAQLPGADLKRAQLQGADLRSAHFEGADLRAALLQGADLRHAMLVGANLGCYIELYLECAQLQGANLGEAALQFTELESARLQGANLHDANLQGARLDWAELQGADLHDADLSDSEFTHTSVFRTNIAEADFEDAAIGNLLPGSADDVEIWIAAATELALEKNKAYNAERFERLKPTFQTADQDAADRAKWEELETHSLSHDPNGALLRGALATLFEQIACDEVDGVDGALYIIRGLISSDRLAALGDRLEGLRKRMKDGRYKPEKCLGVADFTEEDWRKLDAVKSD
jgi:uncharacterized protein YjbI with pentapeptide repeats